MAFTIGDIVSNEEIVQEFGVSNQGGMRRSKANNCLLIVSDHTKALYDDKWHGTVLHYTGMGRNGDQTLEGNQNKTLYESDTNDVTVHLFEVFESARYTYRGIVTLAGVPYQEEQLDEEGNMRKVWMFPLQLTAPLVPISAETFTALQKQKQKKAKKLSDKELLQRARANAATQPGTQKVTQTIFVRDSAISEYAKRISNGICALCGQPAPFCNKEGEPYLETHHIVWLSNGGEDSLKNTVALCPNCHRKMHIVNDARDIEKLQTVAAKNFSALQKS